MGTPVDWGRSIDVRREAQGLVMLGWGASSPGPFATKFKTQRIFRLLSLVVVFLSVLSAGIAGPQAAGVAGQTKASLLYVLRGDDRPTSLAFSEDGRLLVSASDSLSVQVWDMRGGRLLRGFANPGDHSHVAISRDGKVVASVGLDVKLWDTGSGQFIRSMAREHGVTPCCVVAFSADGRLLAGEDLLGATRWVRLWDTRTGSLVRKFGRANYEPNALSFSPNGHMLVVEAGEAGNSRPGLDFWDVATGRLVRRLTSERFGLFFPRSLAFSPDGATLAAVSLYRTFATLVFWDLRLGREIGSPLTDASDGAPSQVAFSPDGRILAIAWFMDDGSEVIRLWDVRRQVTILTLRGDGGSFERGVRTLKFSGDSTLLVAVVGSDIIVWDVQEVLRP